MSDIQRSHSNARLSKIVRHGGLIFLCGQTANRSEAATGDIRIQTREVLSRIDALLVEAGSDRSRILSTTIFLANMEDAAGMNAEWEAWMSPEHAPARATVQAQMGTPSLRVEMSVVAAEAA